MICTSSRLPYGESASRTSAASVSRVKPPRNSFLVLVRGGKGRGGEGRGGEGRTVQSERTIKPKVTYCTNYSCNCPGPTGKCY